MCHIEVFVLRCVFLFLFLVKILLYELFELQNLSSDSQDQIFSNPSIFVTPCSIFDILKSFPRQGDQHTVIFKTRIRIKGVPLLGLDPFHIDLRHGRRPSRFPP